MDNINITGSHAAAEACLFTSAYANFQLKTTLSIYLVERFKNVRYAVYVHLFINIRKYAFRIFCTHYMCNNFLCMCNKSQTKNKTQLKCTENMEKKLMNYT